MQPFIRPGSWFRVCAGPGPRGAGAVEAGERGGEGGWAKAVGTGGGSGGEGQLAMGLGLN